jgi:TonB-dependent receptor
MNNTTIWRLMRCALALIATTVAAAGQGTGRIAGKVMDGESGRVLSGASVRVAGTAIETFTNSAGEFQLRAVPTGQQTVEFSYIGYPQLSNSGEVRDGETVVLNGVFAEGRIYELDEIVVRGTLVGTARALNQQRAAATYTNIVAADDIGRFPDQNAAEALSRLPGLAVYRDQGEGRFVVVRGINFTLGNVTLDGAGIASPESGERGVPLDVVGSDSLAAIEVSKVPTPDKTPEGLGGSINLRSRSPFDAAGTSGKLTAQGIYSNLTGDLGYKFNGEFSTLVASDTIGILIGFSQQKRKFGSFNYETSDSWTTENYAGGADLASPALTALQYRDYVVERERSSVNAALEFRPNNANHLWLRGAFNDFADGEERYTTVIPLYADDGETLTSVADGSGSVSNIRRVSRRARYRDKLQDLMAFSAGSQHEFERLTIDTQLGYSEANEAKPGEFQVRFRRNARDSAFDYEVTGYEVRLTQTAGPDFTQPASITHFQRVDFEVEEAAETDLNFQLNARYELNTGVPTYIKVGGSYRDKSKQRNADVSEWTGGPATYRFANYVGVVGDYPYGIRAPRVLVHDVRDYFLANRAEFSEEVILEDSYLNDWKIDEQVTAAYAMASSQIGNWQVIGGVRYERTEVDSRGNTLDLDANGDLLAVTTVNAKRSYDNFLPGLHFRYTPAEDTVVRLSLSNSIVRPAFGEVANARRINRDDMDVVDGNPALKALESMNFDVSIEHYMPRLGLLSAALFYKDISNFIFLNGIAAGIVIGGDTFDYARYDNGRDGYIYGIELAYQQQLKFVEGLGFILNLTLSDSQADYGPAGKFRFVGQSEYVGNAALTYESGKFFARLSANFRGDRLREDEEIQSGFYVDDSLQFDFSARYTINARLQLFAEWVNITNEPFRVYAKGPQGERLLQQFEEYDWSANFGLRMTF